MPRTFAYVRVSTTGQTTENQIQEIEAAGFHVEPRRIVTETVSGSTAIAHAQRLFPAHGQAGVRRHSHRHKARPPRPRRDRRQHHRQAAYRNGRTRLLSRARRRGPHQFGRHDDHERAQCRRPIRAGFADRADTIRPQARQVGRKGPRPPLDAQRKAEAGCTRRSCERDERFGHRQEIRDQPADHYAGSRRGFTVRSTLAYDFALLLFRPLLCLIQQARAQCRDELIEMLLRRVRKTQNAAREKLKSLQDEHREIEEKLITVFGQVLESTRQSETDMEVGRRIRAVLAERGGLDLLSEQCETVSAFHHNNDLPLLWPIHAKVRALLFRLLEHMDIRSTTQDLSLLEALDIVIANRSVRRDELAYDIDLSFASQRWLSFVVKRRKAGVMLDRRALEVCVFIHLADALQAGDVFVVGAETFDDYRTQLLSWSECETRLADYCTDLGLPQSGEEFAKWMKEQLMAATAAVNAGFPENTELSIDASGVPHLKQQKASSRPEGLVTFEAEIHARMRERHLLDILKDSTSWTAFTRHFGPPSGADPKVARAMQRYILTVFGYGCNLGPVQTARHAVGIASADTLRRLNAQHIDTAKLEAAMTDLINAYDRFELPKLWGAGQAAIADGTHIPLRENNLLGSQHIRYGAYGGIAYHHIADNYVALFTTFIPCGVWEAIHILDGLLKNRSTVQPDTLHADTQGQSEPVFGLARLLGIKLMPRMRNWADVTFYRPDKSVAYQHIDALFGREIDWRLIETHWQDMMQVILSIQAGLVLPSMLLRKLSSHNRKNRLYQAFRELGRVERTLFLLRYISDPQVRRSIRAETTKIESFNDFLDWITFGGPVIKSGDPVEQEKQVKYASLVANAIMLSNVADLTDVINSMAADGLPVTPELAASLSPYARAKIRRFGKYSIDMEDIPKPLAPAPLPFEIPL